jgi:hypothetical protein
MFDEVLEADAASVAVPESFVPGDGCATEVETVCDPYA